MPEAMPKKPYQVFQVTPGLELDELPQWARDYRGYNGVAGSTPIFFDMVHCLKIPDNNRTLSANASDWLVFDGKKISVMKHADFMDFFDLVGDADQD
jgi:hypothetical protein